MNDSNWFKKLFIDEAKPALKRHSGKEPVIKELTINENKTYTAPEGVDGYNPVTGQFSEPDIYDGTVVIT